TLTRTGSVIGTPAYMAPEQAAGARGQVGPTSDVYSLGAILYHMMTGRPPFQAASPVDTVLMLLEQDPITPRVINRQADRSLEMIAMRCLQKPQDLRYKSAGGLADDLQAFLDDKSVSATRGRFGHVMTSFLRDTHHANVMENWGLLWMWHSLVLFAACAGTQVMYWMGVENRWLYWFLWVAGFGAWAMIFWWLRRRMGPVTFIERQIAHLWAGSIFSVGAMFPLEWYLDIPVLRLSPLLALVAGNVFLVKASMLSGGFYGQAVTFFITAFVMALFPDFALLIFGAVSAACFFLAGLKYYRKTQQ
ncbi:MAG: protein kinase domain-containing protein, partial [Pirellulaceae bacterium]